MFVEIVIDVAVPYIRMAEDLRGWLSDKGYSAEVWMVFDKRKKCDLRFYIAPFHTQRDAELFKFLVSDEAQRIVWVTDTEGLPVFISEEQLNRINSLNFLLSPGSNFAAKTLREASVTLPMKVVPRTLDFEKINRAVPLKSDEEYILFIGPSYWGMKHQRKGIEEAYEAMRIVNAEYPNLKLHHVTTNYPEAIGIKIPKDAKIQIDQNYGYRKYEEIIGLVKGAKMLIAPSHCEGWNLVALEAMASGTPLVFTDVPAQNEFAVGEKVSCYGVEKEMTKYGILNELHLFKPEDLTQAILNVYENPTYAQELAEKAYEKSLEYDQNKVFPDYLKS